MSDHETDTRPGRPEAVLEARDVRVLYHRPGALRRLLRPGTADRGVLHALDAVDLTVRRGETLALVGESGSGKSTLANVLVGAARPTSGEVLFEGEPIHGRRSREQHRRIQMVFQDPYSSLNPRKTVRAVLTELLALHRVCPPAERPAEVVRLLGLVGLGEDALDAYPGQFSGGQRQRLAIARALAVRPDVLVADEPVSALDVSVQANILHLIARLQRELGLSVLFIAHNLAVVRHLCQRVAVMYLGRIVEVADVEELFGNPQHPYTRALIESIPRMRVDDTPHRPALSGEQPSPLNLPPGCRFAPRCRFAQDSCKATDPVLGPVSGAATGHVAACLRTGELPPFVIAQPPAAAGRSGAER